MRQTKSTHIMVDKVEDVAMERTEDVAMEDTEDAAMKDRGCNRWDVHREAIDGTYIGHNRWDVHRMQSMGRT